MRRTSRLKPEQRNEIKKWAASAPKQLPKFLPKGLPMDRKERLLIGLESRKVNAENAVALVLKEHKLIDSLLHGFSSRIPHVKFGCSRGVLVLSEKRPDLLYPKIDRFFALLGSENRILKWNAIGILGNLAAVDRDRRIRSLLPKLYECLSGGELITANNTIAAPGMLGRAFPEEQERITARLLEIEHAKFKTDECRNIAIGKAILAVTMFLNPAGDWKEVLDFARRQRDNGRRATATKAEAFLRKYERAEPAPKSVRNKPRIFTNASEAAGRSPLLENRRN